MKCVQIEFSAFGRAFFGLLTSVRFVEQKESKFKYNVRKRLIKIMCVSRRLRLTQPAE